MFPRRDIDYKQYYLWTRSWTSAYYTSYKLKIYHSSWFGWVEWKITSLLLLFVFYREKPSKYRFWCGKNRRTHLTPDRLCVAFGFLKEPRLFCSVKATFIENVISTKHTRYYTYRIYYFSYIKHSLSWLDSLFERISCVGECNMMELTMSILKHWLCA